jgi:hypothetical protein
MSRQLQLLQWRKMSCALSRGSPHRKHLLESPTGALSVHVVNLFLRYRHCLFTLLLTWNVDSSERISLSTKQSSSIFNRICSQNSRLFTLSAGVLPCTRRILYCLEHGRLRNTFNTVNVGTPNFLLAVATDLQGLR